MTPAPTWLPARCREWSCGRTGQPLASGACFDLQEAAPGVCCDPCAEAYRLRRLALLRRARRLWAQGQDPGRYRRQLRPLVRGWAR